MRKYIFFMRIIRKNFNLKNPPEERIAFMQLERTDLQWSSKRTSSDHEVSVVDLINQVKKPDNLKNKNEITEKMNSKGHGG